MDKNLLLERYKTGKRDFAWVDLKSAQLAHTDLTQINFYHANLSDADLSDSNLTQANFLQANLVAANLSGANLSGANLRNANLQGANLDNALLDNATLQGAILPDGSQFIEPDGSQFIEPDDSVGDQEVAVSELAVSELAVSELETRIRSKETTELGVTPQELGQSAPIDSSKLSGEDTAAAEIEAEIAVGIAVLPRERLESAEIGISRIVNAGDSTAVSAKVLPENELVNEASSSLTTAIAPRELLESAESTRLETRIELDIPAPSPLSANPPASSLPPPYSPPQPLFPNLLLLSLGYSFFGTILSAHHSHSLAWLLTWAIALLPLLDDSLIWYVPLLSAIAILPPVGIYGSALVFAGFASLFSLGVLYYYGGILDWKPRQVIKDGAWVGGIMVITMHLATWIFYGTGAAMPGYVITLLLVLGIVTVGRGAVVAAQMRSQKFDQAKIARKLGLTTAIGLSLGGIAGFFCR